MTPTSPIRIAGVVPPVPTPFKADGSIDESALRRVLNHLIEGGVHGAFILGSTGELASLRNPERETVIRVTVDEVAGRIPVLVGIADTCLAASVDLAKHSSDLGANVVVAAAPFYYELSSEELVRHFSLLLETIEMPTMVYNMPWLTGHVVDEACMKKALEYSHMIGFKDSSGDRDYLRKMVAISSVRQDTTVLVGNESLFLDALKMGAHGVVGGGGNIHPQMFRALYDAFEDGSVEMAEKLQSLIDDLGTGIYSLTGNPTSVFATIKAALKGLGLCESYMAPPLTTCKQTETEFVKKTIMALDEKFSQLRAIPA